jgi:DNA-binding transcriptional LysR family regulator
MRYGLTTDREWPFLIDSKERRVVVRGHRIANDGELVRVWCRNGLGIARKSRLDVEADLKTGNLVEILQDFSSSDTALQIVYPATPAQPKRVRLLIERIAKAFSSSSSTV